jgi:hypothetical protein
MDRVLPVVTELASRHPERTVFARFIPPKSATDMLGMWQRCEIASNRAPPVGQRISLITRRNPGIWRVTFRGVWDPAKACLFLTISNHSGR